MLAIFLFYSVSICNGFWFYGYDRVFRDPYPETTNNEIVQTSVITYLASIRNNEIQGIAKPYSYKVILFESITQNELDNTANVWNIGVWESFMYCDENQNTLCLLFSDGEYCDNDYFRETLVELTCHYESNNAILFDINEYEECIYSAKLYFPELCASQGTNTVFLRDAADIEKIKASSYISDKGNKINLLPYTEVSGTHNIGISITVNEIDDVISITMHGPLDKYFAIGFGSNGMFNTYAIVVSGADDNVYFEQLLDSHASGYTLPPSFIMDDHTVFGEENTHQITISRKLSSSVEMDIYWLFSCVDDYIDIIWSVGKAQVFERHIAFGQDRLSYDVETVDGYDRSQIINNLNGNEFALRINWSAIFILTCVVVAIYYFIKKYKPQIMDYARQYHVSSSYDYNAQRDTLNAGNSVHNEYGSVANQQDTQPLIQK